MGIKPFLLSRNVSTIYSHVLLFFFFFLLDPLSIRTLFFVTDTHPYYYTVKIEQRHFLCLAKRRDRPLAETKILFFYMNKSPVICLQIYQNWSDCFFFYPSYRSRYFFYKNWRQKFKKKIPHPPLFFPTPSK